MNPAQRAPWILPVIIALLALCDGALHLSLDAILFRGNFFGRLGPPPGAAPTAPSAPPPAPPVPMPLPLNQMFVLNLVGYAIVAALVWFAFSRAPTWRVWVDALVIVYAAAVFLAWWEFGRPNPQGLGYLSKAVEVMLILAALSDIWQLSRRRSVTIAT